VLEILSIAENRQPLVLEDHLATGLTLIVMEGILQAVLGAAGMVVAD
jgi:hypothetical protein